jgi:hypothetical protein
MNRLDLSQQAGCEIIRHAPPAAASELKPRGQFKVEHWRGGRKINEWAFPNGITDQGKIALLEAMFHSGTQITTWYLGLIDLTGYTSLLAADTYANINQAGNHWAEFTDYTVSGNASNRAAWGPDAASANAISNGTAAVFDITSTGTVKGVFCVGGGSSPITKSDHTAGSILWATALFNTGDAAVQSGDQLKVTYTTSA